MHAEGIILFRSAAVAGAGQQWFAVFHDGSFVAAKSDGSRILRFSNGSICEKADQGRALEAASGDAPIDWIATSVDGQRCGIALPDAAASQLETAEKVSGQVCFPFCFVFSFMKLAVVLYSTHTSVSRRSCQPKYC